MDERKPPSAPHLTYAGIAPRVEPIVIERASRYGQQTDAERSLVYCGGPQSVAEGFAIALRAMGIGTDSLEYGCLPPTISATKEDD
jgi:hypothetical protein